MINLKIFLSLFIIDIFPEYEDIAYLTSTLFVVPLANTLFQTVHRFVYLADPVVAIVESVEILNIEFFFQLSLKKCGYGDAIIAKDR